MAWSVLSSDEQTSLVHRIRAGDAAAEEAFARLFGERVHVMMLTRVRDAETARELTQDVLLAAWRAIRDGQLRDAERLAAFVHGVARNLVNCYVRTRARTPRLEPIDDADRFQAPPEDSDRERRAQVAAALARVSAEDRQVLLLTLVHGLKPGEIAARLGLTPEAVRARKSRAIKRVVDSMAEMSRTGKPGH